MSLQSLNLSHCNLSSLSGEWFTNLHSLMELGLNHNSLSSVPLEVVNSWNNAQKLKIYLSDNPWDCSCSNEALFDLRTSFRNRIPDYDLMSCSSGEHVSLACQEMELMDVLIALLALLFVLVVLALLYRYGRALRLWMFGSRVFMNCLVLTEKDDDESDGEQIYDVSY